MIIAVCDDNRADRETLIRYLEAYLGENVINNALLTEYENAEALLEDPSQPDLLFLDIFMYGIFGMYAAHRLMERGFTGGIIFTSTSSEFGAESYEVNALDYLLKPYSYDRFLKAMGKCDAALRSALASITIPSGRLKITLFLRDILYIETGNHCLLLHTTRNTYKSPMTMEQAESALSAYLSFIRCHRSYLINLAAVDEVNEESATMTNGDRVLLNIKNAAALRRQIADYIWREMEARHD